jgi:hypothetical protein
MLIVSGHFTEVLAKLFRLEQDAHVRFGPARSCDPVTSLAALSHWCPFDDYVMEGGVRYALRARPHAEGLMLEIQLTGSNRDRFVHHFVRDYVKLAGCVPRDAAACE